MLNLSLVFFDYIFQDNIGDQKVRGKGESSFGRGHLFLKPFEDYFLFIRVPVNSNHRFDHGYVSDGACPLLFKGLNHVFSASFHEFV